MISLIIPSHITVEQSRSHENESRVENVELELFTGKKEIGDYIHLIKATSQPRLALQNLSLINSAEVPNIQIS